MRLIDADELKEVMCRSAVDTREKIGNIIDNAPTVEPCKDCEDRKQAEYIRHSSSWHELQALRKFKEEHDRPQGEWIIIKSPLSTETVVKCPFCHDEFIGNDVEHYNYCPICNADLRGKEK